MHDPKLVEALGWEFCRRGVYSNVHAAGLSACPRCRADADAWLAEYRLVQLPEDPIEWEVEWEPDHWVGFQTREDAVNFANENRPSTTGRIRAVRYVVRYGEHQEVEP